MKMTTPGLLSGAEKGLRQISNILSAMGCKLKKIFDNEYKVLAGLEDTGLQLYIGRVTTEQNTAPYVLAVATYPMPENDNRFHRHPDHEKTKLFPHVRASLGDNKDNTVLFEFLSRSVHYFITSKLLRKWRCYNCLEIGFEAFLADGSVSTFDSIGNEFSLVIVGPPKSVQGIVYDDKIDKNVLPICANCRDHLSYELSTDSIAPLDKTYFQRLLASWPDSRQVMKPIYGF